MIKFEYQPTLADFRTLNRQVIGKQLRSLTVISVVLLVLFLVFPLLRSCAISSESTLGIWAGYRAAWQMLLLPGLVGFLYVVQWFAVKARWRAAEEIRVPRVYEFDETGVRVTGPSFAGFMGWQLFSQAREAGGLYLLKTNQNQFYFFPVGLVPDRAELDRLVAAHIVDDSKPKARKRRWVILGIWLAVIVVAALIGLGVNSAD